MIIKIMVLFFLMVGSAFAFSGGGIDVVCGESGKEYLYEIKYTGAGMGGLNFQNQEIIWSCNQSSLRGLLAVHEHEVYLSCKCEPSLISHIGWWVNDNGVSLNPLAVVNDGEVRKPIQDNSEVFSFLSGMLCASAFVSASLARLF